MTNINKILITVVVCVFMVCVATVSVVKIVTTSDKTETTTQAAASVEESTSVFAEGTTNAVDTPLTSTQTYTDPSQTVSDATAATSTAVSGDLQQQLLGKWSDSLGMLGFEFYDDGTVNTTYFDLKQLIGLDLSGSTKLPYTLEGDILTIKFSAYTGSAQWQFRVSVNGNELTMYDLDKRSTTTLTRVS